MDSPSYNLNRLVRWGSYHRSRKQLRILLCASSAANDRTHPKSLQDQDLALEEEREWALRMFVW